jgi:hypothetical protein
MGVMLLVILLLLAWGIVVGVDDGFNGSTLSFGSTVAKLRSLGYSESANEADVSSIDDGNMKYVGGVEDIEISAEIVGYPGTDVVVNATNTLILLWNTGDYEDPDGSTTGYSCICTGRESSGDMNGEITTSLTFKPYGGA